jgi:hypothetical protein
MSDETKSDNREERLRAKFLQDLPLPPEHARLVRGGGARGRWKRCVPHVNYISLLRKPGGDAGQPPASTKDDAELGD